MEQYIAAIAEFMEMIYPYIVAIIPTLTAIGTCTGIAVAVILNLKKLGKEVEVKADTTQVVTKVDESNNEARRLNRKLNKVLKYMAKRGDFIDDEEV